jgi:topoisomerase-4 subunit A
MTSLRPLMEQNFIEYASYVIVDRAIPEVRDGCKPVQRRILHTMATMDDGKFIKVANVIGECMKLHPHGDASIGDALVVLANKGLVAGKDNLSYFIERQGNFGNILTGDGAAASRYIECRLTALAKETMFNPALTVMTPSYDGRKDEPEALPAKLPVVLMLGTEGIAVGMATTILSHNFCELLQAQIKILKNEPFSILPDFPQGGLMDATDYADGNGKVRLRARIERDGEKKLAITEIPFGTTTESLMASIESAVEKGKVKIATIDDRTGETVRIEVHLPRGIYADEVIPQLYAYTLCEQSVSSNIVIIRDRKPAELTVSVLLKGLTDQLVKQIEAELIYDLGNLVDKQHALTLEQVFIENRVYKRIEEMASAEAVTRAVYTGMEPFAANFVRPMVDADVDRLLELRIKRISQFDIDKNRKDIADVLAAIKSTKIKLGKLKPTTIAWIEAILKKFGGDYPRRTEITTFTAVDKKSVAMANLKLGYDQGTGFFGSAVRASDRELKVTEYDRILVITEDGGYKIMAPPEKTVIEGKILHLAVFDPEKGQPITMVYIDEDKTPWAKVTTITSFIKDREYELIKDRKGRILYFSTDNHPPKGIATCHLNPFKGQRVTEETIDLAKVEPCSVSARGTHICDKSTRKVTVA